MKFRPEINIDNDLYNFIKKNYEIENYRDVLSNAMLYLTNKLREKSGLDKDGAKLVQEAFSLNKPLIKMNPLKTETDKNIQQGMMSYICSLYYMYRNPVHHNIITPSKEVCDLQLIMINYALAALIKGEAFYSINDIHQKLNDLYYVDDEEYINEILNRIPEKKLLDTLISLCDDSINPNVFNFTYKIFNSLPQNEQYIYIKSADTKLEKSNNLKEIALLIYILRNEHWKDISKLSQKRINKILLTSLKDWCDNKNMECYEIKNNNDLLPLYMQYIFEYIDHKEYYKIYSLNLSFSSSLTDIFMNDTMSSLFISSIKNLNIDKYPYSTLYKLHEQYGKFNVLNQLVETFGETFISNIQTEYLEAKQIYDELPF